MGVCHDTCSVQYQGGRVDAFNMGHHSAVVTPREGTGEYEDSSKQKLVHREI